MRSKIYVADMVDPRESVEVAMDALRESALPYDTFGVSIYEAQPDDIVRTWPVARHHDDKTVVILAEVVVVHDPARVIAYANSKAKTWGFNPGHFKSTNLAEAVRETLIYNNPNTDDVDDPEFAELGVLEIVASEAFTRKSLDK